MYIGSVESSGVFHLFNEILDNCLDEFHGGHCNRVSISYDTKTKNMSVKDNGRGIPCGYSESLKMDSLTACFMLTNTGGKFNSDSYSVKAGMNGIGNKCVTALSSSLNVEVIRDGISYSQSFSKGKILSEVLKNNTTEERGTRVSWIPDKEIFKKSEICEDSLIERCIEVLSLEPGLDITLEIDSKEIELEKSENKLEVIHNRITPKLEEILRFKKISENVSIILTQHKGVLRNNSKSYINSIRTVDGGSHEDSIRIMLIDIVKKMTSKKFTKTQISQGLFFTVSIKFLDPIYSGQSKSKINDSRVSKYLREELYEELYDCINRNKEYIKYISELITSQEELTSELSAKEEIKNEIKKNIKENSLPINLVHALQSSSSDRELILVEGKSALGNVRLARNPKTQELLPLKGKIINAFRTDHKSVVDNSEVRDIFKSIGAIEGNEGGLRTKTVLFLFDADSDGKHISTLALSLFSVMYPSFISKFKLAILQPPLFTLHCGDNRIYGMSIKECKKEAKKLKYKTYEIYRFKGLGEMNVEDLVHVIDKSVRKEIQVEFNEYSENNMRRLMGNIVDIRKEILEGIVDY